MWGTCTLVVDLHIIVSPPRRPHLLVHLSLCSTCYTLGIERLTTTTVLSDISALGHDRLAS